MNGWKKCAAFGALGLFLMAGSVRPLMAQGVQGEVALTGQQETMAVEGYTFTGSGLAIKASAMFGMENFMIGPYIKGGILNGTKPEIGGISSGSVGVEGRLAYGGFFFTARGGWYQQYANWALQYSWNRSTLSKADGWGYGFGVGLELGPLDVFVDADKATMRQLQHDVDGMPTKKGIGDFTSLSAGVGFVF